MRVFIGFLVFSNAFTLLMAVDNNDKIGPMMAAVATFELVVGDAVGMGALAASWDAPMVDLNFMGTHPMKLRLAWEGDWPSGVTERVAIADWALRDASSLGLGMHVLGSSQIKAPAPTHTESWKPIVGKLHAICNAIYNKLLKTTLPQVAEWTADPGPGIGLLHFLHKAGTIFSMGSIAAAVVEVAIMVLYKLKKPVPALLTAYSDPDHRAGMRAQFSNTIATKRVAGPGGKKTLQIQPRSASLEAVQDATTLTSLGLPPPIITEYNKTFATLAPITQNAQWYGKMTAALEGAFDLINAATPSGGVNAYHSASASVFIDSKVLPPPRS